jgi:long-subunit acyl-CoA synthetase (AMP-forming)
VLEDARVSSLLCTPNHMDSLQPLAAAAGVQLHVLEEADPHRDGGGHPLGERSPSHASSSRVAYNVRDTWAKDAGCLMVYTSGTTGRPKGNPEVMISLYLTWEAQR